jgi:hypothetical protein
MTTIPSQMPQRSAHTASSIVILVERRPQSLAFGDPCGALGIDPVAQPGSGAMMPLRVRSDPQLPDKMMQREHRNEATGVLLATFLNEAIRLLTQIAALQGGFRRVFCVFGCLALGGGLLLILEHKLQLIKVEFLRTAPVPMAQ